MQRDVIQHAHATVLGCHSQVFKPEEEYFCARIRSPPLLWRGTHHVTATLTDQIHWITCTVDSDWIFHHPLSNSGTN